MQRCVFPRRDGVPQRVAENGVGDALGREGGARARRPCRVRRVYCARRHFEKNCPHLELPGSNVMRHDQVGSGDMAIRSMMDDLLLPARATTMRVPSFLKIFAPNLVENEASIPVYPLRKPSNQIGRKKRARRSTALIVTSSARQLRAGNRRCCRCRNSLQCLETFAARFRKIVVQWSPSRWNVN